ncbi:GPI-anchor transamidase isoform X5 [Lathamus discolor]|uniref:GPI-anchor transamidase isoform X5 n=1 Tax=Lathamus discolor TaxID=678569 RepID=UPI0032B79CD0
MRRSRLPLPAAAAAGAWRKSRGKMAAAEPGAGWFRAAATLLLGCCGAALTSSVQDQAEEFFRSGHTNNWAVLVCTSRFWFNYRHVANTLSVYRSVKRLGIPDSHIVLMLADDMACNPRNPKPATVFSHKNMELNVYGDDVEVDYRSYEVTVENFLRVLTGRIPPSTPRSKRLLSDDRSNILIYMTGHGGNGFLKFQDSEEITNVELADAFEQMWQKRRYNELLFIIDTCQGASMYERFYSPNIMALASSQVGEDSLSHQPDLAIGVHLMDRYTFYVLEFLEEIHPASQTNMNDLFQVCPKSLCVSTPGHRTDLFRRDPQNVLITDFFGSVRKVEITRETISLNRDVAGLESKLPKDELATEPLKYAEQLPVAQIIHQCGATTALASVSLWNSMQASVYETKTKGLASSWRIYFRTLGTDHHSFLQNVWNQAHETRLLNSCKQDDCIDCYVGFIGVT